MRAEGGDAFVDAAEVAARSSYGRVVAYLARRWRDVAAAEDAVASALAAALETWPVSGVPDSPEAWLMTAARRQLVDRTRHNAVAARVNESLVSEQHNLASVEVPNAAQFPDERLRLMLVCAHPAIDESIRTALILQVVLGIEAKRMASVFLLSTEAMTKRLVRAKRKIREAGLRFEEPEPQDLRERLHVLLEAIYAAYVLQSEGEVNTDLASEAIYLARLIADMLPCGESLGFFALLQFIEARRPARVLNDTFIPLLEQDATVWNHAMLDGAYALLARAASYQTTGPFQLEAAIQGAHCHRARSGLVPWHDIAALYALLVASYPTIGSRIAYAVASAHASGDAAKGFALLTSIEASAVRDHQPWWVASAHLHAMAGRTEEAARCFERAIGLTSDARVRKFLHAKREGVLSAAGAAAIAKQSGNVTPT